MHYFGAYKSGAVVVPDGLGVSESLENRIGLNDLVLKRGFSGLSFSGGADGGEVADHFLGVLGFASSRLAAAIRIINFIHLILFYFQLFK